ncbi:Cytochrome c556 [Solimonas aquatica]|uniref:Cytochrome c556 n=1 Tax=Solimonas aquatica TaxID=489703 RepID=A0A1H8ZUL7_9GAMM|nr:cytochrome c [Solimonas aquatica]SEP68015.1 Cytochrome c556 [Solimonas aquatica]
MKKSLGLLLCAALLSSASLAGPLEDQIRYRQSAYAFIGWNTARIKAQLDAAERYNKDQVSAAANAIAAAANAGLGSLYGPGTDQGTGWRPSRLKPEFFQQQAEAAQLAGAFNKEANELARIAAGDDLAAVKQQFARLSETCKNCHSRFRTRE